MKTLTRQLKQAYDALEFTEAHHLHALTTRLSTLEKVEPITHPVPSHRNERIGTIRGAAAATH